MYYLLKWHDADGNDNRAEQYAADNSLPPQFAMIADAYWALDNGLELEVNGSSYSSFEPILTSE